MTDLNAKSCAESYLDEAIEESFPASDPVSVGHAYTHAPAKSDKESEPHVSESIAQEP